MGDFFSAPVNISGRYCEMKATRSARVPFLQRDYVSIRGERLPYFTGLPSHLFFISGSILLPSHRCVSLGIGPSRNSAGISVRPGRFVYLSS